MSRRDSKVDNLIDTEFSSGDCNTKRQFYQEENNNVIDDLSKGISDMGCIVDAVKRPNICVENCIYESESEDENAKGDNDNEEAYSDEFEEDKSEEEIIVESAKSEEGKIVSPPNLKSSKSQTSVMSKPVPSVSGRSSGYGSVSVPPTRRINMSFTNDRLREIERHNHILLNKILSARNVRRSSIPMQKEKIVIKPVPSAAVHRKKTQKQIDHDNMILLKKIQRVKSSTCSFRR